MRSAADKFGLIIGLLAGLAGLTIGVWSWMNTVGFADAREPLKSSFVFDAPIVFLATTKAHENYAEAIGMLKGIHSDARELLFQSCALKYLRKICN